MKDEHIKKKHEQCLTVLAQACWLKVLNRRRTGGSREVDDPQVIKTTLDPQGTTEVVGQMGPANFPWEIRQKVKHNTAVQFSSINLCLKLSNWGCNPIPIDHNGTYF